MLAWPATSTITKLIVQPTDTFIEHTKTPDGWPEVTPPGWQDPLQYTLWPVYLVNGRWMTAGRFSSGSSGMGRGHRCIRWRRIGCRPAVRGAADARPADRVFRHGGESADLGRSRRDGAVERRPDHVSGGGESGVHLRRGPAAGRTPPPPLSCRRRHRPRRRPIRPVLSAAKRRRRWSCHRRVVPLDLTSVTQLLQADSPRCCGASGGESAHLQRHAEIPPKWSGWRPSSAAFSRRGR
jgi:hypothetical protein